MLCSQALVKTDVTALELVDNCLLAGIGNTFQVFNTDSNELIWKDVVFDGLRIHGIAVNQTKTHIILHAEHELLVLINKNDSLNHCDFKIKSRFSSNDWVLSTKWLQYNNIAIVTMHNEVEFLNDDLLTVQITRCNEKCILYAAHICHDTFKSCIILSGTVFSEILVWKPYKSGEVYHRLKGHGGVLFAIDYFNNYILSASDDRALILWKIDGNLEETSSTITMEKKMYGHTSRVFRCQLRKTRLLSGGEDGRICVWDYSGNLLKTCNLHHGGSIWSLTSDENKQIAYSGGSDASIIQSYIGETINRKIHLPNSQVPKKLAILANEVIVVITEKGQLYHYDKIANAMQLCGEFPQFQSYALLEISHCRSKIALAGIKGDIILFQWQDGKLLKTLEYIIPTFSRIFSLHWLTCQHILTCGPNGLLYLWKIQMSNLLLMGVYELPPSKERWSTSACKVPLGFAVGDRKGHLHLFHMKKIKPVHSVRKAHSHLGVTQLQYNWEENILSSLGRDATLRTFDIIDNQLIQLYKDTLPFSWLAQINSNENTIIGFNGDEMLLWDCQTRMQLFSISCGGGHRSWDMHNNNFTYIREKSIYTFEMQRPVELTSSVHSTEINALTRSNFDTDKMYLITGSEDTTLSFFQLITTANVQLRNVCTIKSHLSSIRCLALIQFQCNYYLFSGGGRGQIICWQIVLKDNAFHRCKQLYSFYEPADEEVRIMDLISIVDANKMCLFAACSNGCIKLFTFNDQKRLTLCNVYKYDLRCILKLAYLPNKLLCTMATDGYLCFWNCADLTAKVDKPIYRHKAHQSGINAFTFKFISDNKFLCLTGGDDNQISLTLFQWLEGDIEVIGNYTNVESHCAQINGAFINDEYFYTASLDQLLLIHKYAVNSDLDVKYEAVHKSVISDIKGLSVFESEYQGKVVCVLYGLGIEIVTLKHSS